MTKIRLEPGFYQSHSSIQRDAEARRPSELRTDMDADNQDFSEELESCPRPGFKTRFGQISRRMGLDGGLSRSEITSLYEAAFLAALCNISFNGLGGCGGVIRPEREPARRKLEQAFMDARDNFFGCPGWKSLSPKRKKSIQAVFLTVLVSEENLAF